MKPLYLVAKLAKDIEYDERFDYIGVDAGALHCFNNKIPMICAVGDFDSITLLEKELLAKHTKLIELSCRKDETDTEIALLKAKELGYVDITLVGGLGGRLDHEFANIRLMMNRNPDFKMESNTNILEILGTGKHIVEKKKKYLSIFALEDTCITTRDVDYELTNKKINTKDVFTTSNQIIGERASINVHYGSILIIHAEDEQ